MLRAFVLLDIDGVLLPFGDGVSDDSDFDFKESCLGALSKIINATKATIVLSSTWRAVPSSQAHIISEFKRYAQLRGGPLGDVESFEHTTSLTNYSVRQWEVAEWVNGWTEFNGNSDSRVLGKKRKAQGDGRKRQLPSTAESTPPIAWVALDDDDSLVNDSRYQDLCAPYTVLTDSREGLTDADADRAIAILQRSMSANRETTPCSSDACNIHERARSSVAECSNGKEAHPTKKNSDTEALPGGKKAEDTEAGKANEISEAPGDKKAKVNKMISQQEA